MNGLFLATILDAHRFDVTNEKRCQEEIETILHERLCWADVSREHRLDDHDRPDFLVKDSIVVEVKIGRAPKRSLVRQLERYAAHETVSEIVLVTATAVGLPRTINGKPLHVVSLGKAWL